ncbi:MAG: AI-2E family transporter [Saprospiraceae bacterium]
MKFSPKYLLALLLVFLIGTLLYYFSEIVTYILIAWVISMIGAPIVVFLRRFVGKTFAAIIALGVFVVSFMLIVWIFIPPLVNQIENLSKIDYNKVVSALEEPIRDWEKWLIKKKLMIDPGDTSESPLQLFTNNESNLVTHQVTLDSTLQGWDKVSSQPIKIVINVDNIITDPSTENYIEKIENDGFFSILKSGIGTYLNPQNIQEMFGNSLNAFGNILVGIFSIFFIGFFFLKEQGLFGNIIHSVVPIAYELQTKQAVEETSKLLIRYFAGILIQVTTITVLISSSLALLGVKNALLIGFFAGIMNVIPYIGPIIAAGVGVMITLSSNMELSFYDEMMPLITKVILVFLVVRLIDDILLQPNIFSKSVKAHPLEIFIIVLVGAKIGGIVGMVLAIPFYTAFRVIGKVFLSEFKVIQMLTRHM